MRTIAEPRAATEAQEEDTARENLCLNHRTLSLNENRLSALRHTKTVCPQKENRSGVQRDILIDQQAGGNVRRSVTLLIHHTSKVSTVSKNLEVGPGGPARPKGPQRQGASSP